MFSDLLTQTPHLSTDQWAGLSGALCQEASQQGLAHLAAAQKSDAQGLRRKVDVSVPEPQSTIQKRKAPWNHHDLTQLIQLELPACSARQGAQTSAGTKWAKIPTICGPLSHQIRANSVQVLAWTLCLCTHEPHMAKSGDSRQQLHLSWNWTHVAIIKLPLKRQPGRPAVSELSQLHTTSLMTLRSFLICNCPPHHTNKLLMFVRNASSYTDWW